MNENESARSKAVKAMKNLDAWRLLAELGRDGGYKAASLRLGLDFPTCTRLMQRLEAELGIELVARGARPARLSDAGRLLLPAVQAMLAAQDNALRLAASLNGAPMTIRLSIPVNCPRQSVSSFIQAYASRDSALTVEVASDMNHADVLSGKTDLAMLPYRPPAEDLMLWSMGRSFNILLATPRYLQEHGIPRTPADLARHALILRSGDYYPRSKRLVRGEESVPLIFGHAAFSGDVMSGKEALLKGEGIAISLSIATCRKELESGAVVPVLPGWHRPEWEMTLAMARTGLGNPRLVHFAQAFAQSESEAIQQRRMENLQLLDRLQKGG